MGNVGGSIIAPRVLELAVPGDQILHRHEGRTMCQNTWKVVRKCIICRKGRDINPELGSLAEDGRNIGGHGTDRRPTPFKQSLSVYGLDGLSRMLLA